MIFSISASTPKVSTISSEKLASCRIQPSKNPRVDSEQVEHDEERPEGEQHRHRELRQDDQDECRTGHEHRTDEDSRADQGKREVGGARLAATRRVAASMPWSNTRPEGVTRACFAAAGTSAPTERVRAVWVNTS